MTNTSSLRFLYILGSLAYCAAWQPLLPSSKRWLASPELSETAAFSVSLKDYCRQSLLVYTIVCTGSLAYANFTTGQ